MNEPLSTFADHMGLDPVDMARDLGVPLIRLMDILREVDEPMTDDERDQIERACLKVYGVSPGTMEGER